AFSPDGKMIVTGGHDGTARLWDAATGQPIGVPLRHHDDVNVVAFSPDGRRVLTCSEDGLARVWGVSPADHGTRELGPGARGGGEFAPGSGSGGALLGEVRSGRLVTRLEGHDREVIAVAFSPDGRSVATGSRDNAARLWDAASGRQGAVIRHRDWVTAVAF